MTAEALKIKEKIDKKLVSLDEAALFAVLLSINEIIEYREKLKSAYSVSDIPILPAVARMVLDIPSNNLTDKDLNDLKYDYLKEKYGL